MGEDGERGEEEQGESSKGNQVTLTILYSLMKSQ